MHGVQRIGLGELPNHLFGMQRQWLQRQLVNAPSAGCPRAGEADQDGAVHALSRDRVYGRRTPLFSVQRNRATLAHLPTAHARSEGRAVPTSGSVVLSVAIRQLRAGVAHAR